MDYVLDKNGDKVVIFHGTNRNFLEHKMEKNRTILNDNYQGDWVCYTENEHVGWKYADAARNQFFDKEDFLEETNKVFSKISPDAANMMVEFSKDMMVHGWEKGWEISIDKFAKKENISEDQKDYEFFQEIRRFEQAVDFDINDFCDCLEQVEYSKMGTSDRLNEIVSLFGGGQSRGFSDHDIEMLQTMGYEKIIPEPKIIESHVMANKILETKSRQAAKNARDKGYDLVIYSGADCVDNEPEYLIADPKQLDPIAVTRKIKHEYYEDPDDCSMTVVYKFERENVEKETVNLKEENKSHKKKRPKF